MAIIDFNSVSGVSTVTATSSIRVGSGVTITSTSIVGVSTVGVTTIFVGTGASISSPATNVLTLGTNNVESVRIDSSGRVGIGTTSTSGFNSACDDVVISGSSDVGFTLYSTSTTGTGSVAFTDTISSTTQGAINYFHNGDYMIFQTNASERMRIDSSGRMTLPYQPASCVYNMSASVNTGSESTWQLVKFQNSTVNRGSAYSSSTGLYTCPVAGVYFVSAFFLTRSNAAHNITIYKNGAGIGPTGRDITLSGEQNTGIMAYVDCAANDNLAIYFSNGSGGDFYVAYNYALFSLFG